MQPSPRRQLIDGSQRKAELLSKLQIARKPKSLGRSKCAPKQQHRQYIEISDEDKGNELSEYYIDVARAAARVHDKIQSLQVFTDKSEIAQSESDSALSSASTQIFLSHLCTGATIPINLRIRTKL